MKKGIVMKRKLLYIGICSFLFTWSVQPAFADGEDKVEPGTQWVDPVAFYGLMDITTSDLTRAYDQGDIDVNKVMMEKGVKIYGLKLKPIAAAGHVEGQLPMGQLKDTESTYKFHYQDIMGIRGAPLNEAAFCVYADEAVSRTYKFSYDYTENITLRYGGPGGLQPSTDVLHMRLQGTMNISDMRLVPIGGGVGISYAMNVSGKYDGVRYINTDGQEVRASKEAGADPDLGHFIYNQGSPHLLLMLSADQRDNYVIYFKYLQEGYVKALTAEQEAQIGRPWARVYFEVVEMLVGYEGGEPVIDEETRQELRTTMDGLLAWLSGEGDPFGLGEHTDAKMSAVINTLSTIAAILMTNGLVSIAGGGSGSSLVGTLTGGAGAGGTPPPTPDAKLDALNAKRKEEEEDDKTPPPTPDPNEKLFKQYVKTDADGDLVMKDPVTCKETIYTNNGDGTYKNLNTGQSWTPEEIGERLRYETENQALLRQDADQAARNVAEQRAQWDAQNQRDLERGYSDEQKAYADWKQEQENQIKHEEYLHKMAEKYGVAPTEKAVRDAIKFEKVMNEIDAKTHLAEAEAIGESIKYLEKVDKGCEIAVNVMAGVVPGGETVKNVYTFARSTLVATSEAVAEGKSFGEGAAHILVGMGDGALSVIQNEAGNLTDGKSYAVLKELGINVATENLKEGMKAIAEGKSIDEIGKTLISTTGKKSAEFGLGKLVSGGMDKLKNKAVASLNPADTSRFKFSEGTAKKLDKWLNKDNTVSLGIGKRADVIKVRVNDVGLKGNVGQTFGSMGSVGPGQGFSKFYSGPIKTRALTENLVGEGLSQTGVSDYVGGKGRDFMEWANDKTVGAAANAMYGADKTVEFFKNIASFSDAAAAYKK